MTGLTPRDTREWMRTIERGLLNARGAASGIAAAVVEKKLDDYAVEVNKDRNRTPAAPIELTYQTYVTLGANKRFQAGVIVDFPDVTIDSTGQPLEISQYELWGRKGTDNFVLMATADVSALQSFGYTPGSEWDFKVRAIGALSVKPGLFSAVLTVQMLNDTTAPGMPSTPVASASGRTIKLEWDGKVAGGAAMPLDLDYVIIAGGTDPSPTAEIARFQPGGPQLWVDPLVPYNTPMFYRLMAVDTTGNKSAWSGQASAAGSPLVDDDVILARIDAAKTIISNIGAESIKSGAILQDKLADNAVSQAKLQDQIISLAKLDTTVDAKIQKGIDDAYAADGKAGAAQTAADKARAVVDAVIAAGATLNINGSFDMESPVPALPAGWTYRQLLAAQASDTTARSGTNIFKATPTTATSAYGYTDYIASSDGRSFYIEYWVRLDQALVAGNEGLFLGAYATGYDTANASSVRVSYGDTTAGTLYPRVPLSQLSTTTWTKFACVITTAQANNIRSRFGPRIPNLIVSGNTFEVDDFRVVDVTEAKAALDAATKAQADATKAISDAAIALSSANGRNIITNSTADANNNAAPGKTSGDLWQKWSSLGYGGKLLKAWRWDGTVWITVEMDPTYLPLVDIGQGTFGLLDGVRLKSKSVTTETLLVGDFTNLVDDPNAEGPGWSVTADDVPYVANGPFSTGAETIRGWRINAGSTTVAVTNRNKFTVEPDTELYLEAMVSNRMDNPFYYRILWFDSAGVATGSPTYTDLVFPVRAAGDSGWSTLSKSVKPPAGARQAQLMMIIGNGATTGSVYIVRPMIRRKNGGNMYIDGSVTTNAVATNALTARTMFIGDFANLAIGSDFEDAASVPWTLHADHVITTAQKKSGTSSLRIGAGAAGNRISSFTGDTRVRENEQWYFSFWAYIDASFNGDGNSKFRVGGISDVNLLSLSYNGIARSTWQKIEGTVTVPAGTTKLIIGLWGSNTAGTAYIDDIQIRRVAEASLIQNLGVEKLVVGTGSMDSAVIDTLWTKVVRSQSITTDMLVVGAGQNLVVDPTGADVKLRNARLAESTSVSYGATWNWGVTGGRSEWKTNPAAADPTKNVAIRMISYEGGTTYSTPVEAGQEYVVRFGAYRPSTGAASVRSVFRVRNTDGSVINAGDAGNADGTNGTYFVLQPGWNIVERRYTMPDTAKTASIDIEIQAGATATNVAIRDVFLGMKNSASLIVDGGILTRHLTVTEDMTVALLSAHKVEANEIDTNDLASDTGFIGNMKAVILTADSITGGMIHATLGITSKHTITGATIQTLTTANRGIKITGGNLKAYNSGGGETFSITGSTGAVTGTGTWQTGTSGNYITMTGDSNGGILRFFTGSGTGRGTLWARSVSGGDDRISMAFGNLDEPTGTLPVVVATATASYLNYGSRTIKTWNNDGVEELLLDATNASVVLRGNLDMRDGRTTYRFGAANTLAYVGQRVESGSTPDFEIKALQGGIRFGGYLQSLSTYGRTSTSGANMVVDSAGEIYRSSSASRYKLDQRPLAVSSSALDVKMKDWVDKAQVERYNELCALPKPVLEDQQQAIDSIDLRRIPGLIAEDLIAAGQDQYVIFGPDGQTEGVMYDRFAFAQIAALNDKLDKALERIAALEGI